MPLVTRLIRRNADASAEAVRQALEAGGGRGVAATLEAYAKGLLELLASPASIALNRAAMTSPELAGVLWAEGRQRVGPLLADYLAGRHVAGDLHCPDPGDAFTVFYGLVVRDSQIGMLLGVAPPDEAQRAERAGAAVAQFLRLYRG